MSNCSEPERDERLSCKNLATCLTLTWQRETCSKPFPHTIVLYNSIPMNGNNYYTRQSEWLSLMLDRIWSPIQYEEDRIPSCDSLLDSLLGVFVIIYPPLSDYGWTQPQQNNLKVDWNSDDNVRGGEALVRNGCGHEIGCLTGLCQCRKSKHECGQGCKCIGCTNLPAKATGQFVDENTESESVTSSDTSSTISNLKDQVDQLMGSTADIEKIVTSPLTSTEFWYHSLLMSLF